MSTAIEGGGTLLEVYQSARKLLLRARDGIEGVERLEGSSSGLNTPKLSFAVKKDTSQIHTLSFQTPARSLEKVGQVFEEADSLKESLDRYTLRNQRRIKEAQERAELLGRASGDSAYVSRMFDEEAQAMQSVQTSKRMLAESLSTGEAILSKYFEQRQRLEGNKWLW